MRKRLLVRLLLAQHSTVSGPGAQAMGKPRGHPAHIPTEAVGFAQAGAGVALAIGAPGCPARESSLDA